MIGYRSLERDKMQVIQEGKEWIAVIPPHPDMPGEELGLPAPTEQQAEAEGRAYEAIVQSSLYKFDFDEARGVYVVSLGKEGDKFEAELLADAYQQAQEAYARRVSPEAPAPEASKPVVKRGPRKAKAASNGEDKPQEPAPMSGGSRLDPIEQRFP